MAVSAGAMAWMFWKKGWIRSPKIPAVDARECAGRDARKDGKTDI